MGFVVQFAFKSFVLKKIIIFLLTINQHHIFSFSSSMSLSNHLQMNCENVCEICKEVCQNRLACKFMYYTQVRQCLFLIGLFLDFLILSLLFQGQKWKRICLRPIIKFLNGKFKLVHNILYSRYLVLNKHLIWKTCRKHFQENYVKQFQCTDCDKKYTRQSQLNMHHLQVPCTVQYLLTSRAVDPDLIRIRLWRSGFWMRIPDPDPVAESEGKNVIFSKFFSFSNRMVWNTTTLPVPVSIFLLRIWIFKTLTKICHQYGTVVYPDPNWIRIEWLCVSESTTLLTSNAEFVDKLRKNLTFSFRSTAVTR
jgi:hypothetical protein